MSSARKSRRKTSDEGPLAELARLGDEGATGSLRTSGDQGQVDVFLMGGQVIACGTDEDSDHLCGVLLAAGDIEEQALAAVRDSAGPDDDLADLLVGGGAVAPDRMMAAGRAVFHDNLAFAVGLADRTGEFETQDSVFPSNMQLGLDLKELLDDVRAWSKGARSAIDALGDDKRHWIADADDAPDGTSPELWVALAESHTMQALVARLGPPRREALSAAAALVDSGALVETEEDQYSKAARGGFVKSYEVLDKVDLQGVDILGTGEEGQVSEVSLEAIEAIDMDDEHSGVHEIEGLDEIDDEDEHEEPIYDEPTQVTSLRSTRPEMAVTVPATDEPSREIEIGEDDFDIFGDEEAAAAAAALAEEEIDAGASATVEFEDTPFDREQLNDFEGRIQVFNNIFRVIFGTFAEHIGQTKSVQRFNALLGSGQRQYPELFRDLRVDDNGSVAPGPLINNLAACPPGDYAALLHQGLYELIFSHLYDAKDLLPGDAESEMMEKIVVFERHLHQM